MYYDWGFTGSDDAYAAVALIDAPKGETVRWDDPRRDEVFDVTLYDREVINEETGIDARRESLNALRRLIGLANAALSAGLEPEAVEDEVTV